MIKLFRVIDYIFFFQKVAELH